MKKTLIIIVMIGMFGWAVYDLAFQADSISNPNTNEEMVQEEPDSSNDKVNNTSGTEASVGLNIGDIAPDFKLQTLKGENVKLSDYRGKRVMVNFWATWCPPCRAEMPDMEKFYQNKDVVILAVNLTQTEGNLQEVKDFVNEYRLSFPVLLDNESKVAMNYEIRPIPTSFMIDSNGIIQHKALGALNYERMVQEFKKMK
ncbi:TlpA disulfide reductase family protein [Halobacillus ihumii]|uniref:TlpA disulfide reductase family protein n=1 Tax=Halobacillus ihumii TaxID=2686092 RepID=UPI0013D0B9A6|nr:TlpA disulfide reductase family protein [Halobacillus ihumii]